jgi:hypothetical protein
MLRATSTTVTETEAVLTRKDVAAILDVCGLEGVLVGGQSLAFWADHFRVPRPEPLVEAVSADVDFIGSAALAQKLAQVLGWKSWIPSLDDPTFQTGKVTFKLKDGSVKQADFLSGVVGLATRDVVRRALEVDIPDLGRIRVMHPVDVLDSRIQNLHVLAAKRNAAGKAQARLAIAVVAAFIRDVIQTRGEKAALKLLERVAEIAADFAAVRIFLLYDIDPMAAVPIAEFRTTPALHAKRWPQLLAHVDAQRAKVRRSFARQQERPSPRVKRRARRRP